MVRAAGVALEDRTSAYFIALFVGYRLSDSRFDAFDFPSASVKCFPDFVRQAY